MKYKRVLLKLSGEGLKGKGTSENSIDNTALYFYAKEIKKLADMGCEVGVVIGGGNIWRYRNSKDLELDRVTLDHMGMLATLMNALALEAALKKINAKAVCLSSFPCEKAMETYTIKKSKDYLSKGNIVVFAGGTGGPFFTTDSSAALRAKEMDCDVLFKATKVDGVYDKDPIKFKNAKKFPKMFYKDVIDKKLEVMDLTCASILSDSKIPMLVFDITKRDVLKKSVMGENIGTIII